MTDNNLLYRSLFTPVQILLVDAYAKKVVDLNKQINDLESQKLSGLDVSSIQPKIDTIKTDLKNTLDQMWKFNDELQKINIKKQITDMQNRVMVLSSTPGNELQVAQLNSSVAVLQSKLLKPVPNRPDNVQIIPGDTVKLPAIVAVTTVTQSIDLPDYNKIRATNPNTNNNNSEPINTTEPNMTTNMKITTPSPNPKTPVKITAPSPKRATNTKPKTPVKSTTTNKTSTVQTPSFQLQPGGLMSQDGPPPAPPSMFAQSMEIDTPFGKATVTSGNTGWFQPTSNKDTGTWTVQRSVGGSIQSTPINSIAAAEAQKPSINEKATPTVSTTKKTTLTTAETRLALKNAKKEGYGFTYDDTSILLIILMLLILIGLVYGL